MEQERKTREELLSEKLALENDLRQGDYKVIKCAEAKAADAELPYDAEQLHADRQAMRDRLNEIEEELREIEEEVPETGEDILEIGEETSDPSATIEDPSAL